MNKQMKKQLLSRRGYRNLKAKLKSVEERQEKIRNNIKEGICEEPKKTENPTFIELRRLLMYGIPLEIRNIEDLLKNALIIEDTESYKQADCSTVFVGCNVDLMVDGKRETYWILGYDEYDEEDEEIIAYNTPFAQAIIGAKEGDIIKFRNMLIEIKAIRK